MAELRFTGVSKGGETAIFRDYYYPHDFAGTFAYTATIPGGKASPKRRYQWYDAISGWLALDDQEGAPFFPYNYQAGTQLGYPIIDDRATPGSRSRHPPARRTRPSPPFRAPADSANCRGAGG